MSSSSSPQKLGSVLQSLFAQAGMRAKLDAARAVEAWPLLAGEAVARVTQEVTMRDGVLVVRVRSAAWRHQLQFQREAWRERVNAHLVAQGGGPSVREVRFQ